MLLEQRPSPGQQKTLTGGKAKNSRATASWKAHKSTSSAPST